MNKISVRWPLLVITLLLLPIPSVPAAPTAPATGESPHLSRVNYFQKQLPGDYVGMQNPLTSSREQQDQGQRLFDGYCASCHGFGGVGKGIEGERLAVEPAQLPRAAQGVFPSDRDSYLYWTISEGGVPVHSPMPPFKDVLASQQIWQIILYINTIAYF
ncbi:MAG: cytochrome c [Magnetococcales bacterium]|nr:cytochrome c [Magnetococcales bacterium]